MKKSTAPAWIYEKYQNIVCTGFRLKKRLAKIKSPFQTVEVVQTVGHGKLLLIDGMTMVSERDEFVYHEMIAHVPLFTHPHPRRVLVIGGGDGGTVREVLRHKSVERCVLVEIDGAVVTASKKHLPITAGKLSDPRVEVRIEDGVKFVNETQEKFDVVIIDSTEPFGPAKELFGTQFYRDVRSRLTKDGIVVSQAGSPFYEIKTIQNLNRILKSIFPVTKAYLFTNQTYPGGLWAFTYASQGLDPLADFQPRKIVSASLPLKWYNADIHRGSFALPQFIKQALI
jgi:spermidine synthase